MYIGALMEDIFMTKSLLILILSLAFSACRDFGLAPPGQPSPPRYSDVVIKIGVIPGIRTTLLCTDSLGAVKTSFTPNEPVLFRYSVANGTGTDQKWATAMGNPFARFFVVRGTDTIADSYAGIAFLAMPATGTLKAGDSLTAAWRFDPAKFTLAPGGYAAIASPDFVLVDLGIPGDEERVFIVSP